LHRSAAWTARAPPPCAHLAEAAAHLLQQREELGHVRQRRVKGVPAAAAAAAAPPARARARALLGLLVAAAAALLAPAAAAVPPRLLVLLVLLTLLVVLLRLLLLPPLPLLLLALERPLVLQQLRQVRRCGAQRGDGGGRAAGRVGG
jgi:hypothetical protein